MRSETEIRRQVETRLHRWALLALNAILWVGAAKLIYAYNQIHPLYDRALNLLLVVMLGWAALLALHTLRTIYIEGREWLVKWAIRREHQVYGWQPIDEKPKRRESASLPDDSRFPLPGDDGEYSGVPFRQEAEDGVLVDFPFRSEADKKSKR